VCDVLIYGGYGGNGSDVAMGLMWNGFDVESVDVEWVDVDGLMWRRGFAPSFCISAVLRNP